MASLRQTMWKCHQQPCVDRGTCDNWYLMTCESVLKVIFFFFLPEGEERSGNPMFSIHESSKSHVFFFFLFLFFLEKNQFFFRCAKQLTLTIEQSFLFSPLLLKLINGMERGCCSSEALSHPAALLPSPLLLYWCSNPKVGRNPDVISKANDLSPTQYHRFFVVSQVYRYRSGLLVIMGLNSG